MLFSKGQIISNRFSSYAGNSLAIAFFCVLCWTGAANQASAQHVINAGNAGDYYHNADNLHTSLSNPTVDHPGLTLITPTNGAVTTVTPDKVVIGNASLAYHHPWTGSTDLTSIMRYIFTSSAINAGMAYDQYRANNAYWYPEHRCHDLRDNLHTQTPTVTNSQGSSGSEMDEVNKFIWTLAAFRTDTKQLLIQAGLLMPTVQMIMRRTRVASEAEYLTGKAHPNAFDDYDNSLAMEQMAAGILPTNIPPMVQLEVIGDSYLGTRGVDILQYQPTQRLYQTPVSISRIWKNLNYTNRIIVSAKNSFDYNGRALTFHWTVLRGDPTHVRITPLNAEKSIVEVEIDYHEETTIEGSTRTTNLVSVGAFVNNGFYYSAPGFVTSYTLPSEIRTYDEANGRLLEIAYQTRPVLEILPAVDGYPQKWNKDTFHYDSNGAPTGWTRLDGFTEYKFTPEGYQVISTNAQGQPDLVQSVVYGLDTTETYQRSKWTPSGNPFSYANAGRDIIPPTVASALASSAVTSNSFIASWTASADNIAVAGYYLDISTQVNFAVRLNGYDNLDIKNITAAFINGLSPGTRYYMRVRAYDYLGNVSANSQTLVVQTLAGADNTPPAAPSAMQLRFF